MIDICLFGREISDLVRVSSGRACVFILLSSVTRGLFIRPVVVVEGDARRIFVATAVCVRRMRYKRFVSLSYYGDRQAVVCLADGHDDPASSRVLVEDQSDRSWTDFSSAVASFSALCVGLATNTTRLLGALCRRDISR